MLYAQPYTLTKMDIAALRKADMLSVSLIGERGTVRAIKRIERTDANPFAQDAEHHIAAPVSVYCGWRYEVCHPKCHALVWLYASQQTHAASVLRTLRAGDGIRFQFYPDRFSTQALSERAAAFHADCLMLIVSDANGKQIAQWELQMSICENNSARMVQGVIDKVPA